MNVGVLGAGQLGLMLALAGHPLGLRVRCFDPAPDPPARVAAACVTAPWDDADALARFLEGLDVVTWEFENVPLALVEAIAARAALWPPPVALETGQDRLREKSLFQRLDIDTAPFVPIDGPREIVAAAAALGLPVVVKTRRLGYDGKGQAVARTHDDLLRIEETWPDVPAIVERLVPFEREVSAIAVRARDGDTRFYALPENVHRDGILQTSTVIPPDPLQRAAEEATVRILDSLRYVGVLAVEFFVHQGRLLANELAPRVHNSGHWTIEGAVTSQFENHLRAVCGLPLGDTSARGLSVMVNLVGDLPSRADILEQVNAHLHLYGKTARPGRKVGHVTLCADVPADLADRVARVRTLLPHPGPVPGSPRE